VLGDRKSLGHLFSRKCIVAAAQRAGTHHSRSGKARKAQLDASAADAKARELKQGPPPAVCESRSLVWPALLCGYGVIPGKRQTEGGPMGTETELKFHRLSLLSQLGIPKGAVGNGSRSELVTTYFDTKKHKLERRGLSLRVRENGGSFVQAVKTTSATSASRGEWESEVKGASPDLKKAKDSPLQKLNLRKLRRQLAPVFRTSVHRSTVPVHTRHSEIEIAIDRGRIIAGRRSRPIAELELELKRGSSTDLFQFAKTIAKRSRAELYLPSKAERGYQLARGEMGTVAHATRIELPNNMSVREAFQIIAHSATSHFSANATAVRNRESEGVHQMRVGLRRLRAAISVFSEALSDKHVEEVKAELRWLTNALAPAREIDVFLRERIRPIARRGKPRRGALAVTKDFSAKRSAAFNSARAAVNSERFRLLLVSLLEWVESPHTYSRGAEVAVKQYAADQLRRRLKKVYKAGRHLEQLPAQARHKVRIRAKKIRYALDFFGTVFPSQRKAIVRLARALKQIQEALGALNDFAAHRRLATESALTAPRANRRARAFVDGIVVGQEEEAANALMKEALQGVAKLQKLNVF
jgi:triphosphatase